MSDLPEFHRIPMNGFFVMNCFFIGTCSCHYFFRQCGAEDKMLWIIYTYILYMYVVLCSKLTIMFK